MKVLNPKTSWLLYEINIIYKVKSFSFINRFNERYHFIKTNMAEHLKILDPDEIFQLYSRPEFTDDERKLFFHLEEIEMSAMQQHRSLGSQVYFILQLGYFKACQRFFVFDLEDVEQDVDYILHYHFPGQEDPTLQTISKPIRLDQQKLIMSLFG